MRLNIGSGEDRRRGYINVDVAESVDPDVTLDVGRGEWPWDDGTVDHIIAFHVLEHLELDELTHALSEAHRVLKPGGTIKARVPLGVNATTDPTHALDWTWDTPVHFTESGGEYQNPLTSMPFRLCGRRVRDAVGHGPAAPLGPAARTLFAVWRPGSPWMSTIPCMSFEMEFVLSVPT